MHNKSIQNDAINEINTKQTTIKFSLDALEGVHTL